MLLSAGERIASALLAMTIEELGQAAISFTGSQCGIITSHRHKQATCVLYTMGRKDFEYVYDEVGVDGCMFGMGTVEQVRETATAARKVLGIG